MSETFDPIQLEAGKFYRTRSGREVVGPVERLKRYDTHPWRAGSSAFVYRDDGRLYSDASLGESGNDLVAEVEKPSLTEAR